MPRFVDTVKSPAPREVVFDYDAQLDLKGIARLFELPMGFGFERLAENAKAGLEREFSKLGPKGAA